ncbi:MAG: DUF3784 domain-containing protein [Chitinophagaceae bacterium]|nr:MAG: DUF3784 domain-containing protein [Chitinophagaceae bacterium]
MIYVLILISAVFVGLAFSLTAGNAKYMLSGYNTMTEKERSKVDIKGLIPYFRKFHLFIGVSFLVISLLLISYVSETIGTVFICLYPIVAEIYFVISVRKFSNKM